MKLSIGLRKAGVFIQWYAKFDTVKVGFKTLPAAIPKHLREHDTLVFDYGRNLPVSIPDLAVDEDGISATLTFDRKPFKTFVPWSAVIFMLQPDGTGFAFEEHLDDETPVATVAPELPQSAPEPPGPAPDGDNVVSLFGKKRPK